MDYHFLVLDLYQFKKYFKIILLPPFLSVFSIF
nr:MAG TPA: hypothetical protein [Caudoviricetes sp.]